MKSPKCAQSKPTTQDGTYVDHDVLRRADNGANLSVVHKKYVTVTHREVMDYVDELCADHRTEHVRSWTNKSGSSLYHERRFPDLEFANPNSPDDKYNPTLLVKNSLDRTSSFLLRFGAYQFICSNGQILPIFEIAHIRQRHYGNFTFEKVTDKITHGIDKVVTTMIMLISTLYDMDGLALTRLFVKDEDTFNTAFRLKVAQDLVSQNLISYDEEARGRWEVPVNVEQVEQFTAYQLYCTLTAVATHIVRGNQRRELLDTRIGNFISKQVLTNRLLA